MPSDIHSLLHSFFEDAAFPESPDRRTIELLQMGTVNFDDIAPAMEAKANGQSSESWNRLWVFLRLVFRSYPPDSANYKRAVDVFLRLLANSKDPKHTSTASLSDLYSELLLQEGGDNSHEGT